MMRLNESVVGILEVVEVLLTVLRIVVDVFVCILVGELFLEPRHVLVAVHKGVLGGNLLELVALGVEPLPEDILQLVNALTGNG